MNLYQPNVRSIFLKIFFSLGLPRFQRKLSLALVSYLKYLWYIFWNIFWAISQSEHGRNFFATVFVTGLRQNFYILVRLRSSLATSNAKWNFMGKQKRVKSLANTMEGVYQRTGPINKKWNKEIVCDKTSHFQSQMKDSWKPFFARSSNLSPCETKYCENKHKPTKKRTNFPLKLDELLSNDRWSNVNQMKA